MPIGVPEKFEFLIVLFELLVFTCFSYSSLQAEVHQNSVRPARRQLQVLGLGLALNSAVQTVFLPKNYHVISLHVLVHYAFPVHVSECGEHLARHQANPPLVHSVPFVVAVLNNF